MCVIIKILSFSSWEKINWLMIIFTVTINLIWYSSISVADISSIDFSQLLLLSDYIIDSNTWKLPIFFDDVTHWGQDKIATIFQTIFSNAFLWMKMNKYGLRFHKRLFPMVQSTIFQALVQIVAWHLPGDKLLSEPMMVSLLTHICDTCPQWINARLW